MLAGNTVYNRMSDSDSRLVLELDVSDVIHWLKEQCRARRIAMMAAALGATMRLRGTREARGPSGTRPPRRSCAPCPQHPCDASSFIRGSPQMGTVRSEAQRLGCQPSHTASAAS